MPGGLCAGEASDGRATSERRIPGTPSSHHHLNPSGGPPLSVAFRRSKGVVVWERANAPDADLTARATWPGTRRSGSPVLVGTVGPRARNVVRHIAMRRKPEILAGKITHGHANLFLSFDLYLRIGTNAGGSKERLLGSSLGRSSISRSGAGAGICRPGVASRLRRGTSPTSDPQVDRGSKRGSRRKATVDLRGTVFRTSHLQDGSCSYRPKRTKRGQS